MRNYCLEYPGMLVKRVLTFIFLCLLTCNKLSAQASDDSLLLKSLLAINGNLFADGIIGDFVPLLDPAHGNFPYLYLNENQFFNQSTYDFISAAILPGPLPGTVRVGGPYGFVKQYTLLLSSMVYRLNANDSIRLISLNDRIDQMSLELVKYYEDNIRPISNKDINTANNIMVEFGLRINNKFDYVILYIFGYIWSGSESHQSAPMSFEELLNTPNLQQKLPSIPPSAISILLITNQLFQSYLEIERVQSSVRENSLSIDHALANVSAPQEWNGGITTFNPSDGKIYGFLPGYNMGLSMAQIQNALDDNKSVLRLKFQNKPNVSNLLNGCFCERENSPSVIEELKTYVTSNHSEFSLLYHGVVYVPFSPLAFIQGVKNLNGSGHASSVGWFLESALRDAINNQGCKKTGFCFKGYASQGGFKTNNVSDMKLLTGVLIANQPKVKLRIFNNETNPPFSIGDEAIIECQGTEFSMFNGTYRLKKESNVMGDSSLIFEPLYASIMYLNDGKPLQKISVPQYSKCASVIMVSYTSFTGN